MKRSDIISLMPSIFQRSVNVDDSLSALVDTMEGLQAPAEQVLDRLETYFNPHLTSDEMVPFLGKWVDLDWMWLDDEQLLRNHSNDSELTVNALRKMVFKSFELAKWRGTLKGLIHFLEIATETQGFVIEENVDLHGQYKDFHLVVRSPKKLEHKKKMIDHIVKNEKAAYISYELVFDIEGKVH